MNNEDEVNQAVLAAINEAHKNPRQLSHEEVIEFVSKIPYMGLPELLPAKARGRKPTRTQYDAAFDRRKGFYQKLVRLPNLRKGSGAYGLTEMILDIARKEKVKRNRVAAVRTELCLRKLPCMDDSKIRKLLRKNYL